MASAYRWLRSMDMAYIINGFGLSMSLTYVWLRTIYTSLSMTSNYQCIWPIYGFGLIMVSANLLLHSFYGFGLSISLTYLWLRPISGIGLSSATACLLSVYGFILSKTSVYLWLQSICGLGISMASAYLGLYMAFDYEWLWPIYGFSLFVALTYLWLSLSMALD